ncbi:hypothetical protein STENM327S_06486 [Streptomyces tendae]
MADLRAEEQAAQGLDGGGERLVLGDRLKPAGMASIGTKVLEISGRKINGSALLLVTFLRSG